MLRKIYISILALWLFLMLPILAQEKLKDRKAIENAIESKNYSAADSLLQKDIQEFLSSGQADTLVHYIPLKGKLAYGQNGAEKAVSTVYSFIDLIKTKDSSVKLMLRAYREAAEFFGNIGQNLQGFKVSELTLEYALQLPGNNKQEIAQSEYNLGTYAHRLGNVSLAKDHHRRALVFREEDGTDYEGLYLSYNAVGSIMWYSSKYDSATLYYTKALEALKKMPDNEMNRYYRPATMENNLAALYSAEGKTTEAIKAMQRTVENLQKFIAGNEYHPKKEAALQGLFQAIDNLAGIYKEVGDYSKAGDLLNYSYQQKKQKLQPDDAGIFISEILLGQHYNSIREYDKALAYLTKGLEKLEKADGDYLFWQGDACYTLAMIYENKKETAKAAKYYDKSEELYNASYQGEYDNMYMDFIRNASLFYANNGQYEKAIASARKIYDYLLKVNGGGSLQAFYQLLNMAEVEYTAHHYDASIRISKEALQVVNAKMKDGATILDSVKIEVFKPKAILIHAKSDYALQTNRDSAYLSGLSTQLNNALNILDKRKVLIDDPESINILIADNDELIEFAKKIELERYELTGNQAYLDKFINLHESGIYTRIRSRLDKEKAVQFANLPIAVQQEEQMLKAAIPASLKNDKSSNSELINGYMLAVEKWQSHLEKVKKEYPVYYEMRYGSFFKSLSQLQSSIAPGTTVIRYFFTDNKLTALIADSSNKKLVQLNNSNLENDIASLLSKNAGEKIQGETLNRLYQNLWAPLAADIKTKKLVIIPDGILYNLPFDILAPGPVKSYRELAQSSLLNKYIISYHYSLFMLQNKEADNKNMDNYVAFAPGFFDNEKKDYVNAVNDSVKLDYQYLSLLPQPNTSKLTKKLKGLLGGTTYLNNASTPRSFRQNAAGHKIIHIGTHAEYNNQNPEKSRLIFSKATTASEENNSLYLPDIYSCNIRSDLTILTACESGKPGYQDGEGMVSLAHAFNYAGSNSILTGLWNLDEQSSNIITAYFVENLRKHIPSDEALQKAKLQYLQQAEGRMLAPAYWAGLILMGKPTVINLDRPTNYTFYLVTGGVLLLAIIAFYFKRKKTLLRLNV